MTGFRSDGRPMTEEETNAFLAGTAICRLACLDDDGAPYVVPCWYRYADGGFYVTPRERSAWAPHMARDPRVSLCIDVPPHSPLGRVLVKGRAELLERPGEGERWREHATEMALRYAGDDMGRRYMERSANEPRWLFFVRPERIRTWIGAWAGKYKHSDWTIR